MLNLLAFFCVSVVQWVWNATNTLETLENASLGRNIFIFVQTKDAEACFTGEASSLKLQGAACG